MSDIQCSRKKKVYLRVNLAFLDKKLSWSKDSFFYFKWETGDAFWSEIESKYFVLVP